VETPHGHCTDSFYFVGDQLIVHNKATFTYIQDASQGSTAMAAGATKNLEKTTSASSHVQEADALAEEMGKLQSA
jgi:hypothetical protein